MHCCAITPAGTRCTRQTATDVQLGRCVTHYNQSREHLPAVWAEREFVHIVSRKDFRPRMELHFPAHLLTDAFIPIITRAIIVNMATWREENRNAIRDFYATRAVGTKIDITAHIAAYEARVDATVPAVAEAFNAHPVWGPRMRGEAPVAPPQPDLEEVARRAVAAAAAAQEGVVAAIERANLAVAAARAPRARRAPVGELGAFAADNQNVHTVQSVELTKTVVARVLKIAVAKEYQWNRKTVSRTPAEIIWACSLHPKVAMQMMEKYCAADNVYEMGAGIYGRVLDGVYAYIKNSPDKKDLYKILRAELTDNLGMCAQGNLTRLCNVLAGYLEGIGSQESPADRLGRELPKLLEIEDETRRMEVARGVLRDTGLPEAEWAPWLEALA